jgi:hypothetical protein
LLNYLAPGTPESHDSYAKTAKSSLPGRPQCADLPVIPRFDGLRSLVARQPGRLREVLANSPQSQGPRLFIRPQQALVATLPEDQGAESAAWHLQPHIARERRELLHIEGRKPD